jgi:hypothetical protein
LVIRRKWQRSASCAIEKPANWKKDLQAFGEGRESRKRPTLVVQETKGEISRKTIYDKNIGKLGRWVEAQSLKRNRQTDVTTTGGFP